MQFDPNDPYRYYSIELRQPTGWDAGFLDPKVLISDVKRLPGEPLTATPKTFLLRDNTWGAHVQSFSANGVTINVESVAPGGVSARVRVLGDIARRCLPGFVWREARPGDNVCVDGATRAQTWAENAAAAQNRSPTGGPYGPDTCKQGFVWREADPFDYVCVTRDVRADTANENALASSRCSPTGGAYGPNTCLVGFVWREAYPGDVVCVPGASRARARADNAAAPSRVHLS